MPVKIHIVEDDPGVNEALRMLLQSHGHTVVAHGTALELFAAPLPLPEDYVIVDLALPDIDGVNVIRWIRNLAKAPRVIVISGQSQRNIDRALMGLTPTKVLRKPLNGDVLVSCIN
jgi:two-component system KDP operon response regulator KdpE